MSTTTNKIISFNPQNKYFSTECSICLNDFTPNTKVIATKCRHLFHDQCLKNSPRSMEKCFVCKTDLTTENNRSKLSKVWCRFKGNFNQHQNYPQPAFQSPAPLVNLGLYGGSALVIANQHQNHR